MLRKLALSLAVAGALSATQAHALGLGEIRVNSALNEPLNAEIKLLQVRDLSPLQIQPRMADIDEFSLAGISKSRFLSDVSFDVRVMPDGTGLIRMKSTTPIKEPFLNFLVEVNWPAGRLVREYTLLLDPPVFDPTPVPGVTNVQPAQSTAASMPQPTMAAPTPSKPAPPANVSNIKTRMDPNAEIYVDVHDTLWELALKNRPNSSVTPEQMMLALVRKNPESFPTGNINVLKAGTVMRLPTTAEINSLTPAQARDEAARQTRIWREGRTAPKPVTNEPVKEGADAAGKPTAPAKPEQVTEPAADKTPSAEDASQLKVVAPEGGDIASAAQSATADDTAAEQDMPGSSTDAAADIPASEQALVQRNEELENRLLVTQESISVLERDNSELNDKIDSIASQLDKLQRLVELKDRELALMQQQLDQKEQESAGGGSIVDKVMQNPAYLGGAGAAVIAFLLGLFLARRKRKEEPEEQASSPAAEASETAKAQPSADSDAMPEMAAAAVGAAAVAATAVAAEEPVEEVEDVPAAEGPAVESDELDDLDLDLDMELDLDESGALEEAPAEPIGVEEFDLGIDEIDEASPQEPEEESLDSALDDILAGGGESVEPEEDIDTGLDDLLAENGTTGELDDLPGPLDGVEEGIEEAGEESPEELDFTVDAVSLASEEDEEVLELPDDLEFDLSKAADEPVEPEQEETAEEDDLAGLDFSVDTPEAEAPSAAETVDDDFLDDFFAEDAAEKKDGLGTLPETSDDEVEPVSDGMIDLSEDESSHLDTVSASPDLYDSFEEDEDIEELMQSSPIMEEPEVEPLPAIEPEVEPEAEAKPESAPEAVDISEESFDDLDAMLASFEPEEEEPVERKPTQHDLVEDELTANIAHDLEIDLDSELDSLLSSTDDDIALEEESAEEAADEPDLLDSMNLLDGADEIETKLDLARAYIEMEDTDGAKDILNEILNEGNQTQRTEAERLLETLN